MSRIASLIRATDTGQRSYAPPLMTFCTTEAEVQEVYFPEVLTLYRIQLVLGLQVSVRTDDGGGALETAISRTKEAVIQDVFGEFRQPINELRMALYERNTEKALDLVDALYTQMYRSTE